MNVNWAERHASVLGDYPTQGNGNNDELSSSNQLAEGQRVEGRGTLTCGKLEQCQIKHEWRINPPIS